MTRLERIEKARAVTWDRHWRLDLNRHGNWNIMSTLRAERIDRLDEIIARLKRRVTVNEQP